MKLMDITKVLGKILVHFGFYFITWIMVSLFNLLSFYQACVWEDGFGGLVTWGWQLPILGDIGVFIEL